MNANLLIWLAVAVGLFHFKSFAHVPIYIHIDKCMHAQTHIRKHLIVESFCDSDQIHNFSLCSTFKFFFPFFLSLFVCELVWVCFSFCCYVVLSYTFFFDSVLISIWASSFKFWQLKLFVLFFCFVSFCYWDYCEVYLGNCAVKCMCVLNSTWIHHCHTFLISSFSATEWIQTKSCFFSFKLM